MNTMPESLARAQMSSRMAEAKQRRLSHQFSRVQRVSRKAEQAARQTRMSLANAL